MPSQRFSIEAQEDFLEGLTKARPLNALAELIWNSLDADATKVEVKLGFSELGGLDKIIIEDNGHGIDHADASDLFGRLGGSWKRSNSFTKTKERELHGSEGRGRLKALALGRLATWHVTYRDETGGYFTYTITLDAEHVREGRISEQQTTNHQETGVTVEITTLFREFRSLTNTEEAAKELTEIFALYSMNYKGVSIVYEGIRLNPSAVISDRRDFRLSTVKTEEESYEVDLDVIEWRSRSGRALYLCNKAGFPLSQVSSRFHVAGDFQFSAYLKSGYISKLHNEALLSELDSDLSNLIEESREKIKTYAREQAAARARRVVEDWKSDEIYPYQGDAAGPIESAERQVFDIVAVTASEYLSDFSSAPRKNKAFNLRMLRTAIEKSPDDLQVILTEVLGLPKRKQKELADLLQDTSLSAIIGAARIVADRLNFLVALERILFGKEEKKRLKERSQLHKILAENTWIFGEQFNLTVNEKSLTEVLRKHRESLGGSEIVIDRPVKRIDKSVGIVDLMLSRSLRRYRPDTMEHIVVELKRPSVTIGTKEISQIESYAFAVADDERFEGTGTSWEFWVLSDNYDAHAKHRINRNKFGIIHSGDNITIRIRTWAQILDENRARLQFFQEHLEHQVDEGKALRRLTERYNEFLEGVVEDS